MIHTAVRHSKSDMRARLTVSLLYLIFFFVGFVRLNQAKIACVPIFLIFVVLLIFIGKKNPQSRYTSYQKSYIIFLIASVPPLLISIFNSKYDGIYFYVYTLLPLFLYRYFPSDKVVQMRLLLVAELSLFITICLGWAIYLRLLPMNFLFPDVTAAEMKIGYWGISYLGASRNHDYLYAFTCAIFSLYLIAVVKRPLMKAIQIILFMICEISLLASLSRGAMIISLWLFFMFIYTQSRSVKMGVAGLLCVLAAIYWKEIAELSSEVFEDIFLSIFGLVDQNNNGSHFSNGARWRILQGAIEHMVINPIGYGIQNYGVISDIGGGSAENAYLTVMIERGWIAGISFICFLISALKQSAARSLDFYLASTLVIYFLFNYEFTSFVCVFLFSLLLSPQYKLQPLFPVKKIAGTAYLKI